MPSGPDSLTALRALSEAATPGPWRSKKGYGPDRFAPKGYRYVQFGGRGSKEGTDQLLPADANFIVAAVNYVRAALEAVEGGEPRADALWSDPSPRTPEGQRLWRYMSSVKNPDAEELDRDIGQRICQIELEASGNASGRSPATDVEDETPYRCPVCGSEDRVEHNDSMHAQEGQW